MAPRRLPGRGQGAAVWPLITLVYLLGLVPVGWTAARRYRWARAAFPYDDPAWWAFTYGVLTVLWPTWALAVVFLWVEAMRERRRSTR